MTEQKIHQCVYVPWFHFKKCTIKTCKNFTSITETQCLALDRVQPSGVKVITDAELHMYKFPNAKISTRLVSMKRKKALARVKSVLILKEYLAWIYSKYKDTQQVSKQNRYTEKVEKAFPLKIKQLRFENWMWPHLVSEAEYREFTRNHEGECSQFTLQELLHMTDLKFKTLVQSLN